MFFIGQEASAPHAGRQSGARVLAVLLVLIVVTSSVTAGCSVRKFVAKRVGGALVEGGEVYASDNDIDFVGDAVPFGLKTIEGLLAEVPRDRNLLLAAASGFVQYAYAYVDLPTLAIEPQEPERARELRRRAKRLYLRGHGYALRALELRAPQFKQKLREEPQSVLLPLTTKQVPELYWAAVSLSAAIAADKQDLDLVADFPLVEPMIRRCLTLDPDFNMGAIHQFLISFEGGRSAAQGGTVEKARTHFARAMELARGEQVSPLVALAESVSVRTQDRQEFVRLLQQALAFDVDKAPAHRLANLVAQRRARLLLSRVEDFFIGN